MRARDLGPDVTHRKFVESLGSFERDRVKDLARSVAKNAMNETMKRPADQIAIYGGR